jgi:nicotinamidase-related amidase
MPLVDRADSTLVVVDAQRVFFDQPSMTDEERAQGAAALERLRWLAGLAALLEVPAVVVEEGPQRNGSTDEQLLERLPPGTPVLSKETFSLVAEDGAVAAIRDTGRRTAVVGGFETDTCVAQSAIQLNDLGFRVVVPEDAAYTTGDVEHRRGLEQMRRAGVETLHCKGVAFEWLRTVEDATRTLRAAEERFGPPPLRL